MADSVKAEMATLHRSIGDNPNLLASIEALVQGVIERMRAALQTAHSAGAQAVHLQALTEAVDHIEARKSDLAAAVVANTPQPDQSRSNISGPAVEAEAPGLPRNRPDTLNRAEDAGVREPEPSDLQPDPHANPPSGARTADEQDPHPHQGDAQPPSQPPGDTHAV